MCGRDTVESVSRLGRSYVLIDSEFVIIGNMGRSMEVFRSCSVFDNAGCIVKRDDSPSPKWEWKVDYE